MTRDEARTFYLAAMGAIIPSSFFDMVASWNDERRALMVAGMQAVMPAFYESSPVVPTGLPAAFDTVKTIWDQLETKDALQAGEKAILGLNLVFDLLESLDNEQQELLQASLGTEQMTLLAKLLDEHLSDFHARKYGHLKAEMPPPSPDAPIVTGGASLPEETHTVEAVETVIDGVSDSKLEEDRKAIEELLIQSQRA